MLFLKLLMTADAPKRNLKRRLHELSWREFLFDGGDQK